MISLDTCIFSAKKKWSLLHLVFNQFELWGSSLKWRLGIEVHTNKLKKEEEKVSCMEQPSPDASL